MLSPASHSAPPSVGSFDQTILRKCWRLAPPQKPSRLFTEVYGLNQPDLDLYQLAALAGFVVYAAKRYCPQYCGGQTDIYMLPKRYSWNTLPVSEEKINALEAILAQKPPECLAGLINEAAAILR